ncbi:MAG: copper amine oxidase N-terminal domain-containing protein, partial [Clostridia bacterium]|nr:copper amine oxidase N-terminal domain-containing protein [Clostridia bacterium]
SAKDGVVVSLTVGEAEIIKNGEKIKIDVPALIMNNRTLVPARAVAESFGVSVEWDKDSRTVLLTTVDTSSAIQRTGNIESPNDEHHAYGKFYFGMTLQECWDAVGVAEGEKTLVSNADGTNEIHIKVKDPALLTGGTDCDMVKLLFTDNYLFCVKALTDTQTEELVFTDEYVKTLLYGYEVPQEARETLEKFLGTFCSFNMKELSLLCSSQNSVRRMGIEGAEDVVPYMGFDRQALVGKLIQEAFGTKEEYKPLAEAVVNPVEGVLVAALSKCTYGIEKIVAVSDGEIEAQVYFIIPDVTFVLESANSVFETALAEAVEASISDGTLSVTTMTEKDMILALSPMIEKLLTQSFLAYLEYCPTIEIPAREKLCAVLHEGQWVFRADSDFVKEMLSSFNMFE